MIRLRDDTLPITLEDLREQLGDRVADYKLPRVLVLAAEPLPRNAAGKLDKATLAALAAERDGAI